jgi:hypothetical protein
VGSDAGVPATFNDRILDKFDPLSFTPDKSTLLNVTPEKFDPVKSTPGPTMYPFKYLYPNSDPYDAALENVIGAAVNICIPPDRMLVNVAFDILTPVKTVLLKSSDVRFAPDKSTRGPTMYVPRIV